MRGAKLPPRGVRITFVLAAAFLLAGGGPTRIAGAGWSTGPSACPQPRIEAGPGPVQRAVSATTPPFAIDRHRAEPRAVFVVDGTVLGVRAYHSGPEAAVSPMDLALGWGPMADPAIYGALGITQSRRWYHYRWGEAGPPLPVESIIANSGNLHLVPASPAVADALSSLEVGQRVRLAGWLVDIVTPEGYRWPTSLRRDDTGDGACEIVYVCEVAAPP